MSKLNKISILILINIFIFFLLFEIFSFILIEKFNVFNTNKIILPTYFHVKPKSEFIKNYFVVDNNNYFGAWHIPNSNFRHEKSCFIENYYFNNYGARDFNRNLHSKNKRAIFLGDSMTEGFGVDSSLRFTNLLEKNNKIECLNFGTSGNFGTTQSRLLYIYLASKFDHNYIFIELLPANDFDEDDLEYGKINFKDRYRPYFIPELDTVIYYLNKPELSSWNFNNPNFPLKITTNIGSKAVFNNNNFNFIKKIFLHFYTYHLLARIKIKFDEIYKTRIINEQSNYNTNDSRFYFFNKKNISILESNILKIKKYSNYKKIKIILYSIPTLNDLKTRVKKNNKTPLNFELGKFSKKYGITYIDFLEEFIKEDKFIDNYLLCDGHLSKKGNYNIYKRLTKEIQ